MGQQSTAVMSLVEAHSHAKKRVTELRSAEYVEAVLAKAMQAENVKAEAEEAVSKANAEAGRLNVDIAFLKTEYADLVKVGAHERKVRGEVALREATKLREESEALVKALRADMARAETETKVTLEALHVKVAARKHELEQLTARVKLAREDLDAMRAGLEMVQ